MAYCPTCKQEFTDVSECPTDHVPLVAELPYQTIAGEGGTTWVEIASTGNEDEASIIEGFLEAEGIAARVENVKFSMEPITFGTMGDIRVYVGAEDEQRAQQLMKARETAYETLDDEDGKVVTDEGNVEIDESAMPENTIPETE